MAYELTINRVGALGAVEAPGKSLPSLSGKELIGKFRRQVKFMYDRSFSYTAAQDAILKIAKGYDRQVDAFSKEGIAPGNAIEEIEVFEMPVDSVYVPPNLKQPVSEHLVGLFPSRKINCTIAEMGWILRARASITACALERPTGLPKLWWTFEGIPADPDPSNRPTEDQAAKFIAVTSEMAREAMPGLRDAYREALFDVVGDQAEGAAFDLFPERICINLTDNDDQPLAELIDAMHLKGAKFTEVSLSTRYGERAHAGALEFGTFVEDITDHRAPLNDRTVTVHAELPALKALICQYEDGERRQMVLAGLARSSGMRGGYASLSDEQKRVENGEGYIRSTSAARPLSAMLASREAILLDDRLSNP